jgi:hypothetical protein
VCSDEFREKGRFAFLDGVLWVDLTTEQFYTHGGVKTEVTRVLGSLIRDAALGLYCSDATLLSHPDVGLSTMPDGLFVSYTSLQSGRVRRIPNARIVGAIELVGAPEMVLEVVSSSMASTSPQSRKRQAASGSRAAFYHISSSRGNGFDGPRFSIP